METAIQLWLVVLGGIFLLVHGVHNSCCKLTFEETRVFSVPPFSLRR